MMTNAHRVKIQFPVEQDGDGYPPVTIETLWANAISDGSYEIDNIPFYARDVNWKDRVSATCSEDGMLTFERVLNRSGHSTIRIIALMKSEMPSIQKEIESLRCTWEGSDVPSLISVDIPPTVKISDVRKILDADTEMGRLEYEEACIQHED